jgi:hypothetical protein
MFVRYAHDIQHQAALPRQTGSPPGLATRLFPINHAY